jgi:hypothetical protein
LWLRQYCRHWVAVLVALRAHPRVWIHDEDLQ